MTARLRIATYSVLFTIALGTLNRSSSTASTFTRKECRRVNLRYTLFDTLTGRIPDPR